MDIERLKELAEQLGRESYGFEIKKEYVDKFENELAKNVQISFLNLERNQMKIEKMNNYREARELRLKT